MKKIILLILTLTLLTFPACSGGGDSTTDTESESESDSETLDPILSIPISPPNDIIQILISYGYYGDCEVYCLRDSDSTDSNNKTTAYSIAGYEFHLKTIDEISVAKDGTIYNLKTAYESGLLTKQDIYNIGTKVDSTFTERYPTP